MHSYNNTFHRTIKMTPSEVNAQNEEEIRTRLYRPKSKLVWKFRVGDQVIIIIIIIIIIKEYANLYAPMFSQNSENRELRELQSINK